MAQGRNSGLKVLITQIWLSLRGGTESVVRDLAFGLLARDYNPIIYTPVIGKSGEEIRERGVPVIDDIRQISEPPDVIHGHHTIQTAEAIIRFPHVPAINICHGWSYWGEAPVNFPQIQFHVGVSEAICERILNHGFAKPDRVRLISNGVDLKRIPGERPPLSVQPGRAAAFAKIHAHLPVLREACSRLNIAFDVVGADGTDPHPERWLSNYDLIFATGRSAIEALCAGCAVIVCDPLGMAGFVTPSNFHRLRRHNFALRSLVEPLTVKSIMAEIARYNAAEAAEAARIARREAPFEKTLDQFIGLYHEAIDMARAERWSDEAHARALIGFLHDYLPRRPGDGRWLFTAEREHLLQCIAEYEKNLAHTASVAAPPRPLKMRRLLRKIPKYLKKQLGYRWRASAAG